MRKRPVKHLLNITCLACLVPLAVPACDDGKTQTDGTPDAGIDWPVDGWPEANEWSWDGRWEPQDSDFPIDGLLDDEYFDGHPDGNGNPTPILPPGRWDWEDANDDLANWRNFETNLGTFEMLTDTQGRHFGWRFIPNDPTSPDYSGAAEYFEGSSGTDILHLGPNGVIHSMGACNLADGPDILVFRESYALDLRTGSSDTGALRDNDLVVAGCNENPDGSFDILTTTVHTGPGRDWVFIRDLSRTGVDLGNGQNGRTDAVDPDDGDDLVVLRGNTHDFRVFGGGGNDVAVWYVDDNVQTETWLGPNFFGGGGIDNALWDDPGTDRLVLVVPPSTELVATTPTPPGAVMVRATDGSYIPDEPTQADPYARYCVECGTGPGGRKTVIIEYVSADESIHTGYFFVTAFEELQLGTGDGARVYRLDDITGLATLEPDATPFEPPEWPAHFCP